MVILYFSGTGNSRYVAETFSTHMQADCHSIEEGIDFDALLDENDTLCFCYPIYGSCVPRIVREFVTSRITAFQDKKLILLCTQLLFSGDGARVFTDLLKGVPHQVIYAEHIHMPNNICNFFLMPVKDADMCKKMLDAADSKMQAAADQIRSGIIRKRGFNWFSKALGYWLQRSYFNKIEDKARKTVRVNDDCTACGLCVRTCPTHNLRLDRVQTESCQIQQNGNCTLCYRCVNLCPQKAITVMLHARVKRQYHGPK